MTTEANGRGDSNAQLPAGLRLNFDPDELLELALQDRDLAQAVATAGITPDDLRRRISSAFHELSTAPPVHEARRAYDDARRGYDIVAEPRRLPGHLLDAAAAVAVMVIGVVAALLASPLIAAAIVVASAALAVWGVRAIRMRVAESVNRLRSDSRVELLGAAANWRLRLVDTGVRPLVRGLVNERAAGRFRTYLTVAEEQGLAEVEDPRHEIPTAAKERVAALIEATPGASIGIAGPRGSGKSTLIRSFCPTSGEFDENRLAAYVPAPVEYGAREFVLHLFAEVCRVVIGPRDVEELRAPVPALRALRGVGVERGALLVAAAGTVASTLLILRGAGVLEDVDPQLIWGTAGAVLSVPSAVLLWLRLSQVRRRAHARSSRFGNPPGFDAPSTSERSGVMRDAARGHLTDIWFQQSFSTGWSGTLELPIGISAGYEGARELARQQMSYPDVVREFRRFLETAPPGMQVLIGIDELDKMSPESARQFLNDIKVIFGLPRVYYLLSVSEDAMSSFERRGLPIRDVFDSTFDDVVRVGYLTTNGTVDLLQRRMIGVPIPFLLLCHVLAGGLARDVIRTARAMVAANRKTGDARRLNDIAHALVAAEVRSKAAGSIVATRIDPDADLQDWLRDLEAGPVHVAALIERCEDERAGTSAIAIEMRAFCLYAATVLDHFDAARPAAAFARGIKPPGHEGEWTETTPTDGLAAARQALATSPRIAWDLLRAFRAEHLGAATPASPEAAVEPRVR
jgi:hypothetical protein